MTRRLLAGLALLPSPALSQQGMDHLGHTMHGQGMGTARAPAATDTPAPNPPAHDHSAHQAPDTPARDPAGHSHDAAPPSPSPADPASPAEEPLGTDQLPGSAAPPPIAHDRPADRYYDPAAMARAHDAMMADHAGGLYSQLAFNIAEVQMRRGQEGYRWDAEAWFGNLNRFVLKSEGEGSFGERLDHGEVQALYNHALDPWWNLQLGARQDFGTGPDRTYAALGIEGRAPYQFDVSAAAFLSDKGQLRARLEGLYDQRITQRLIFQPRLELNFAVQDMPANRLGPGLNDAELGLRLRYEIRREFAPYLGLSWTWQAGRTADYARADGHDPTERAVVIGIRAWF
ncbi:MAG: copper resistance protein B [Sphingomonas sp.]|nr:copper resistance protein B [Sphingomonas sp.]